jgi:hypothetical protein
MTFPLAFFGNPFVAQAGLRVVGTQAAAFNGGSGSINFNLTGEIVVPSAGDLVIVCTNVAATYQTANAGTTTSGYATITAAASNDTRDACSVTFWKIMGSTPDTSVGIAPSPSSDASNGKNILIAVFRGHDPTSPIESFIDVEPSFVNFVSNAPAPINPPNITTVRPGAIVMTFGASTGFGQLTTTGADILFGINASGGLASATSALAIYNRPTPGAFVTPSFTAVSAFGNTGDSGVAVSIVVRPPA